MAKTGERIAAITLALLFLVTSLGFSGLVIWQMHQDSVANKKSQDSVNASSTINTNQSNANNNSSKEGKLEGTKLTGFTPVTKIDTLQKIDIQPGTGDEVKPGDTVTVHYTGAVAATGVIFQSSKDTGQPVSFGLSQVIKGWTDGVPGMKVGGTRRLLIPAAEAYGAKPPAGSNIPANADLVFDIELVRIGQ